MTPWEQLERAGTPLDVRQAAARVLEIAFIDRALYLRRVREAQQRIERAWGGEAAGLLDLDWSCPGCEGAVRVIGQKDGRERGVCSRCRMGTSRRAFDGEDRKRIDADVEALNAEQAEFMAVQGHVVGDR